MFATCFFVFFFPGGIRSHLTLHKKKNDGVPEVVPEVGTHNKQKKPCNAYGTWICWVGMVLTENLICLCFFWCFKKKLRFAFTGDQNQLEKKHDWGKQVVKWNMLKLLFNKMPQKFLKKNRAFVNFCLLWECLEFSRIDRVFFQSFPEEIVEW